MVEFKKEPKTKLIRVKRQSARLLREIATFCRRSQISIFEELIANLHDVVSEYKRANLDYTCGDSKLIICVYGSKMALSGSFPSSNDESESNIDAKIEKESKKALDKENEKPIDSLDFKLKNALRSDEK